MATILDIQENLKNVKSNIKSIASRAVQDTEVEFLKLNVEQLEHGFDSQKKRLKKYRSKEYADFKSSLNSLPGNGNPDLILTGAFTESFNLNVSGDNFKIFASDQKANDLTKKYGDDIFGLTEESNEFYAQNPVLLAMMESITAITGL